MTTTEYLMKALGWQGGTVHQVATATGLNVQTILALDETKITDLYQLEMYNGGYTWAMNGGKENNIPQDKRGYPLFWLGAMDAIKAKK